jgi:hypothetical protein
MSSVLCAFAVAETRMNTGDPQIRGEGGYPPLDASDKENLVPVQGQNSLAGAFFRQISTGLSADATPY